MINVLTNDGHRLFEAALFGSFLIASIVLFFECIIYACLVLGYTALTGVATYIIFVPVQVCLLYLTIKASIRTKDGVCCTDGVQMVYRWCLIYCRFSCS